MKIRERRGAVRRNGRGRARQEMTLAYPGPTQTQLPIASRRPLRPSALPAPRPRIAVRPLSSCGSGRPCCAKLLIADPRDRIEEIVMHGNWKGLVFLLNEDRNQILSPALVRHSPERRRHAERDQAFHDDWLRYF